MISMQIGGDTFTLLLIIVLVIMIIYMVMSGIGYMRKKSRMVVEDTPLRIITTITCVNRDYNIEREFREGDFIGKIEGQCPRCGSEMVIDKIYAIPITARKGLGFSKEINKAFKHIKQYFI